MPTLLNESNYIGEFKLLVWITLFWYSWKLDKIWEMHVTNWWYVVYRRVFLIELWLDIKKLYLLKKIYIFVTGSGCHSNSWRSWKEVVSRNCWCCETIYMGIWGGYELSLMFNTFEKDNYSYVKWVDYRMPRIRMLSTYWSCPVTIFIEWTIWILFR